MYELKTKSRNEFSMCKYANTYKKNCKKRNTIVLHEILYWRVGPFNDFLMQNVLLKKFLQIAK